MHITEKRIEIRAPVERVFDLFSDFESFPRWMKTIKEVRYTGARFMRWAAEAPFGTEVEWETETTVFEPDHRIAWRSVRGDVDTEGEVIFEETRRGITLMRVVLGYALPAGRLGEMVAGLFGKNPERQLEADLARFAAVAEGRRRRGAWRDRDEAEHKLGGRRRRVARESMIGPRERRRRERSYYAGDRQRGDHEGMPHWERGAHTGFEEALRAARRSQLDDQRRYAAERERRARERDDEQRYERDREYGRAPWRVDEEHYAHDDRRPAFAGEREDWPRRDDERPERHEQWEEARPRKTDERYDEEERRPRPRRYALTPRERVREQERRRAPDDDYSEQAFHRGVDKLMNEPPSTRWRRWG